METFAFLQFQVPESYTIHVENLLNIREINSKTAMKYAKHLTGAEDLMFLSRNINQSYDFEFFALGKRDKRTVPLYLKPSHLRSKASYLIHKKTQQRFSLYRAFF
jgi:hypothetical protein